MLEMVEDLVGEEGDAYRMLERALSLARTQRSV